MAIISGDQDEQLVLSFPDKSITNWPTQEGWKVWLAHMGGETEPTTWCIWTGHLQHTGSIALAA